MCRPFKQQKKRELNIIHKLHYFFLFKVLFRGNYFDSGAEGAFSSVLTAY